jgi:CDP-diacylglycerol---glycerol-3-phosphate 3-phosphatidyltransferase
VPVYWIALLSIWFMVLLSLVSAADYFIAFWSRIDHQSERRRKRRTFVLARRRKRDVQAV